MKKIVFLLIIVCFVICGCLSFSSKTMSDKSIIVVPLEQDACWQDFAYLAAVPAGAMINKNKPAVLALEPYATLRPEAKYFLNLYKPSKTYLLDCISHKKAPVKGLLHHWPFDDKTGNICRDTAGKSDSALNFSEVWKSKNKNYLFDGCTLNVGNGNVPGSGRELSVAFWMKPDARENQLIMSKYSQKNQQPSWRIILRKDHEENNLRFRVGGGRGGWNNSDVVVSKNAYKPGEWVHVVCTFANGVSKIYLNGMLKATRKNITWGTPNNTKDPLIIGETFTGMLDDVRIYHRELNLIEVQNMPSGMEPARSGLVAYWPMDESKGKTVHDKAGENNLVFNGKPVWEKGRIKGGLHFKKKEDTLKLGCTNDSLRPFSILFSAKSKKKQKGCILCKPGTADQMLPWSFYIDGTNLIFKIGNAPENSVTLKNVMPVGKEVEVTLTCEKNIAKIYIAGNLSETLKIDWKGEIEIPVEEKFNGIVDNIRLYDHALSVGDIKKAGKKGLISKWKIDWKAMKTLKGPSWTDGKLKGGLHFNGINDYVVLNTSQPDTKEKTIAFWVKPEKAGCLISRLPYEKAGEGWAVTLKKEDNSLQLLYGNKNEKGTTQVGYYLDAYIPETWLHVAISMTEKDATLFLDGQKVFSWKTPKGTSNVGKSRMILGAIQPGICHFKGTLDELRIYERKMSERQIMALFGTNSELRVNTSLPADSASQAACSLAKEFWTKSDTIVTCNGQNYTEALVASSLAARLRVPLLYYGKNGFSKETLKVIEKLSPERIIDIGKTAAPQIKGIKSIRLADEYAVLAWMKKQGMVIDYLAVANPKDRTKGRVKKLSLMVPLLAAARKGGIAILDFDTTWKHPVIGTEKFKEPKKGWPDSSAEWKSGTINLNNESLSYLITTGRWSKNLSLYLLDKKGMCSSPLRTGDRIKIGKLNYTLCLDPKSNNGKADLSLTWPGIPEIREKLKTYYDVLGGHPEYLCILGEPDVIPHGIVPKSPGDCTDLPSDQPLVNTDADPFIEIAQGRIVGEDLYSASLTVCRELVYDDLIDSSWATQAGSAGWPNLITKDFEDVGFNMVPRHTGKEGVIRKDSPLCNVGAIVHGAHSSWLGLGGFYPWNSRVLLAPALIESSGCSTMRLCRDEKGRSAPERLLRNGVVAVDGNIMNGVGQQEYYKSEFWNAILSGYSVGKAHRFALNRALLAALARKELKHGGFRYQFYIRTLFGDPAMKIHLPGKRKIKPAYFEKKASEVVVYPPEKWWKMISKPNPEWHSKYDLLHLAYGAGVGRENWWSHKYKHGQKAYYYTVELPMADKVNEIIQTSTQPKPLGWDGKYWIDEHQNGTCSVFWRVKMLELDMHNGNTIKPKKPFKFELKTE